MDDVALATYCTRLRLSEAAQAMLARVRNSQPARSVRGRVGNVTVRYPSRKMGRTIQAESRTVELLAILDKEFDPSVLEYYDQPPSIPFHYVDSRGRRQAHLHTPDFFVLSTGSVGWEEWKSTEEIKRLAQSRPYRFTLGADGLWHSPPGEAFAVTLGLTYRVRTPDEIDLPRIRNLKYLADYLGADRPEPRSVPEASVIDAVRAQPGLTLLALAQVAHVQADDLLRFIAGGLMHVDLSGPPLSEWDRVRVFADQVSAEAYAVAHPPRNRAVTDLAIQALPGVTVTWDGRVHTIVNVGTSAVFLRNGIGQVHQMSLPAFADLVRSGSVQGVGAGEAARDQDDPGLIRLRAASPQALRVALSRYSALAPRPPRAQPTLPMNLPSPKTLHRWQIAYDREQESHGSGFLGLVPKHRLKGNRLPRLDAEVSDLMDQIIATEYADPRQRSVASVYHGSLAPACRARGIALPSQRTFRRRVRARQQYPLAKTRLGSRGAYALEPQVLELNLNTPRHGDRPFEVVHIDHTLADVELVDSSQQVPLGKPWFTLAICANTRRILAVHVSFDPPSYRTLMVILRILVKSWGRLPESLVVDGGKEFRSVYFETLLARHHVTKITRPSAKPRFGSVIERLFGTSNAQFIHNLEGNTQITQHLRQVTQGVDPKRRALWTLLTLHQGLSYWATEVYDQIPHPCSGLTPRQMFDAGLRISGSRPERFIPYTLDFILDTYPTTVKGSAKVQPSQGVKINKVYYWSDAMRDPRVERTSVPVRFDPFDLGVAFAFIRGQWERCLSQHYARLQGRTEHERRFITEELRRLGSTTTVYRDTLASRLGDLQTLIVENEAMQREIRRQAENRLVVEASTGQPVPDPPNLFTTSADTVSTPIPANVAPVPLGPLTIYNEL